MPSEPTIHTHNLARRFGRRWAYARVNLELFKGERLLLIGANGSGKTTLLRTFATLLPPSLGSLRLFGQAVSKNPFAVRRKIGLISHHMGLYEALSATENLRFFGRMMGRPITVAEAERCIESVGLDIRPDPVQSFSAGMRKRVSIAALLLKEPELVLLDEPFSALDPQGMDDLSQLLHTLQCTLVIASHQVERAAALCGRAILLENATIRWQGEANKAWQAWRLAQQVSS